jgi:hypothetical protein
MEESTEDALLEREMLLRAALFAFPNEDGIVSDAMLEDPAQYCDIFASGSVDAEASAFRGRWVEGMMEAYEDQQRLLDTTSDESEVASADEAAAASAAKRCKRTRHSRERCVLRIGSSRAVAHYSP